MRATGISKVQMGGLGVGLLAILFLPYLFRPTGQISDAYMVGFSTRAALGLTLLVTLGFAWWTRGAGLEFPSEEHPAQDLTRATLYWTSAITLAGVAVMWWAMHFSGPLNEATYFADRLLMQQSGAKVYRDFEFPYGPLLFYLPTAMHRLTRLSWGDSYLLGWFLQWVAGCAMLWQVVRMAATGAKRARTLYLLLWGIFLMFVTDGGEQYTPVRYCAAMLLALMVQKMLVRRESALPAFALASAGVAGLNWYSPEQAFVLGAASLVFLGLQWRRQGYVAGMGLFLAVSAGSAVVANHLGWLNGIKAFGGGGLAFPLVVSFQNVLVLLLLVAAACGAVSALMRRKFSHPLLYLCLISGAAAPAAFGRADPGHLLLNVLGALIAAFLVLEPYPRLWFVATRGFALFLICWFFLLQYGQRRDVEYAVDAAVARGACENCATHQVLNRLALAVAGPARPAEAILRAHAAHDQLPKGQTFLMPFGGSHRAFDFEHGNEGVGGYYGGLLQLMSLNQVQLKMDELAAAPGLPLLVPYGDSLPCTYDPVAERRAMRNTLLPIYTPKLRRLSVAAVPFCDYVQGHYRRADGPLVWQGMQIWEPVAAR